MGLFSSISDSLSTGFKKTTSFLGDITGDISKSLESGIKQVAPVWVGKQLGLQQKDQLSDSTFNPAYAPRSLYGTGISTGEPATVSTGDTTIPTQKVLFDVGSISVTPTGLIGIIIGLGVLVFVLKKV